MKRILAAVSLALLAASVFAAERGLPYEKTQFDRGIRTEAASEQGQSDRVVPLYNVPDEHKSPW